MRARDARRLVRTGLLIWLVVACCGIAAAQDAAAQDLVGPVAPDPNAPLREIQRLYRQGDHVAALDACRQYLQRRPQDVDVLYNVACLENLLGRPAAAAEALQQAVDAGFTDLRRALTDPDLAGLSDDPTFAALLAEHQSRLMLLSREVGADLRLGVWSRPLTLALEPVPGAAAGTAAPDEPAAAPELRVRWQPQGLELELTASNDWLDLLSGQRPPPWAGGPGVVVTLAVPDGTSSFESANWFLFAFGTEKEAPVGAGFDPTTGAWSPLPRDLVQAERNAGEDQFVLRATVPWISIRPFHPLSDADLGLNAAFRTTDARQPRQAALLPDPNDFNPQAPVRRYAHVRYDATSVQENTFLGRLPDSILGDDPVDLTLLAFCAQAGTGRLTLDFLDSRSRSVLPRGPQTDRVQLTTGANTLTRTVDFSGLQPGSYVVRAELTFPDGGQAVWSTPALRLPGYWFTDQMEVLLDLPPTERATLQFLLDDIRHQRERHARRRDPSTLVGTVLTVTTMLEHWQQRGSVLPTSGRSLLAVPGSGEPPLLCSLYLPAGWKNADALSPVLLLTDAGAAATVFADRIGRSYEYPGHLKRRDPQGDKSFPVYVVPHLTPPADVAGAAGDSRALTPAVRRCLEWALDYFAADRFWLSGRDGRVPQVLALAAEHPHQCRGVLAFAGANLARWAAISEATSETTAANVPPPPASAPPLTWLDFPADRADAGRAPDPRGLVEQAGWRMAGENTVRGGLSLTQTTDRLVLWVEDTR